MEHQKRSVSVQQAKLRVQVNEDKDSMDKAVQDQDFLKAAGLKNSIAKAKLVQFIHVLLCWFVGWFIDKKGFTNKPKLLILFVVMKNCA